MENWEFLLQKEGDRSWLPLDSPDVEILEGRYRIVARSNRPNADIEIRITHLAIDETPPKRRIQKRTSRTNPDGLMVVIPFTRLEPGQWELNCSPSDLMSDLLSGAKPFTIQLQVLAHEVDDWDSEWSPVPDLDDADYQAEFSEIVREMAEAVPSSQEDQPTESVSASSTQPTQTETVESPESLPVMPVPTVASSSEPIAPAAPLPSEVAQLLGGSMNRFFDVAEQLSNQLVDDVLGDFYLDTESPIDTTLANQAFAEAPVAAANQAASPDHSPVRPNQTAETTPLSIRLDQDTLIAYRYDQLTLTGHVEAASVERATSQGVAPVNSTDPDWEALVDGSQATAHELQLYLRDPQSLQVLVSDRQRLTDQPPPVAFSFSFTLPADTATHLILGEVLLCGFLPDQDQMVALATQAFTITIDPAELLSELARLNAAIEHEIEAGGSVDLPLKLPPQAEQVSLNLSFLNLGLEAPETLPEPQRPFASLAGQPLPPQIYRPDPAQINVKPPDLPTFTIPSQAVTDKTVASEQSDPGQADDSIAPPDLEVDTSLLSISDSEQIMSSDSVALSIASHPELATTDVQSDELNSQPLETPIAEAPEAIPSIDLPSPTEMAFQALRLQDRFLTRLNSIAADIELSDLLKGHSESDVPPQTKPSVPVMTDELVAEVVVDDEPLNSSTQQHRGSVHQPQSDCIPELPNPLVLPLSEPVPDPVLDVAAGELVAGKPVTLRIKLPDLLPRIYVKLWVIDRETRSLLDGPRWLVEFLPNGFGDLEAVTPLTVPFGSLEIRFEAIAVEMPTQRESHKVAVDRRVIPPDLPAALLDDFDA